MAAAASTKAEVTEAAVWQFGGMVFRELAPQMHTSDVTSDARCSRCVRSSYQEEEIGVATRREAGTNHGVSL